MMSPTAAETNTARAAIICRPERASLFILRLPEQADFLLEDDDTTKMKSEVACFAASRMEFDLKPAGVQ
jgi:hypothetical protein